MEIDTRPLILLGGIYHLGFAVFHLGFWKMFGWPKTLSPAGHTNEAITQVMNLALVVVFAGVGVLSLVYPAELLGTPLGRGMCLLISAFWALRAAAQLWFFSLRSAASLVLTVIFIGGSVSYGFALLPGLSAT